MEFPREKESLFIMHERAKCIEAENKEVRSRELSLQEENACLTAETYALQASLHTFHQQSNNRAALQMKFLGAFALLGATALILGLVAISLGTVLLGSALSVIGVSTLALASFSFFKAHQNSTWVAPANTSPSPVTGLLR